MTHNIKIIMFAVQLSGTERVSFESDVAKHYVLVAVVSTMDK